MSPNTAGWTDHRVLVADRPVTYRRLAGAPDGVAMVHLHGFGISGRYLLPTAERLSAHGDAVVPDLPGYGRSPRPPRPLDIPELAHTVLGLLDVLGLERVVLVGNSMGCPVGLHVAHEAPDRVQGLVMVAPAGGFHNQPLPRAVGQLARDAGREPLRLGRIAVPDYLHFGPVNTLRLFRALTRFPTLDRLVTTPVPSLAVLGSRDPLLPPPARVQEVASMTPEHVTVVLIRGAAHAVNFSHPGELAHVISSWLDGREITDHPDHPGESRVLPITRG